MEGEGWLDLVGRDVKKYLLTFLNLNDRRVMACLNKEWYFLVKPTIKLTTTLSAMFCKTKYQCALCRLGIWKYNNSSIGVIQCHNGHKFFSHKTHTNNYRNENNFCVVCKEKLWFKPKEVKKRKRKIN